MPLKSVAVLFLPETYLPLLLDWKAKEFQRATGDVRLSLYILFYFLFLHRRRHHHHRRNDYKVKMPVTYAFPSLLQLSWKHFKEGRRILEKSAVPRSPSPGYTIFVHKFCSCVDIVGHELACYY
ncbi:hypothetical protein V8C37DRAFT_395616 [Trichoderma ceciliae]